MAVPMASILTGLTRSIQVLGRSNVVLDATMGMVTKSVNSLVNRMADFVKIDESAAAANAIYNNNLLANTGALFAATGGIKNAAMAQAELAKVGLPMAGKNIVDLASRMKLSGQDTQSLMQVMETALGPGNMTEQAINSLSENVIKGAISSRVSNEKVIGALGKLDKTLLMQAAFFGGGAAVTEFTRTLATSVTPAMTGAAGDFAKMIMSGGVDFNALQRLGLEEAVDSIRHGTVLSAEQVKNLIAQGANAFSQQVGDASNLTSRQFASIASGPFGDLGLLLTQLNESISEQDRVGKNTVDGLSTTIAAIEAQLFKPFQLVMKTLSGSFKVFAIGVKAFLAGLSLVLVPLVPIVSALMPLAGILLAVAGLLVGFGGMWILGNFMYTTATLLLGSFLGPLVLVIMGLVAIAEFFGFGPSALISSLTGLFNAQERKEEQKALREATTDVDTNTIMDFYNLGMSGRTASDAIAERIAAYLKSIDEKTRLPGRPSFSGDGTDVIGAF